MQEPFIYRGIEIHLPKDLDILVINYTKSLADRCNILYFNTLLRAYRGAFKKIQALGYELDGNTALLHSHADVVKNEWVFDDDGANKPVQRWVNNMENSRSVLLIYACNPQNFEISSQKSVVIHPSSYTRVISNALFYDQMKTFIPGVGYLK